MTITYTYTVTAMMCDQEVKDKPDLVSDLSVFMTGTDSSDGVSASMQVDIELKFVEGVGFTPFSKLTQETVNTWIEAAPEVQEHKSTIEAAIAKKRLPPASIKRSAPWIVEEVAPHGHPPIGGYQS